MEYKDNLDSWMTWYNQPCHLATSGFSYRTAASEKDIMTEVVFIASDLFPSGMNLIEIDDGYQKISI